MVTFDTAINSTGGAQHFALHPAGIALPSWWCFWFLVSLFFDTPLLSEDAENWLLKNTPHANNVPIYYILYMIIGLNLPSTVKSET